MFNRKFILGIKIKNKISFFLKYVYMWLVIYMRVYIFMLDFIFGLSFFDILVCLLGFFVRVFVVDDIKYCYCFGLDALVERSFWSFAEGWIRVVEIYF